MGRSVMTGLSAICVMILLSGCFARMNKKTDPDSQQLCIVEPPLNRAETQQLQEWMHAADLGYEVDDMRTAILFYRKVAEYFPDTPEGAQAQKRLTELNAVSAE